MNPIAGLQPGESTREASHGCRVCDIEQCAESVPPNDRQRHSEQVVADVQTLTGRVGLVVGRREDAGERVHPERNPEVLQAQLGDHCGGVREGRRVELEVSVVRRPSVVDLQLRAPEAVCADLSGELRRRDRK